MNTVSFRLSNDEKDFMQRLADSKEISLSELAKTTILESLEKQIDLETYNNLMKKHQINDESISHAEMMQELI